MANLVLNGYLQASGDGCGCSAPSGQDVATRKLGLRCSPAYYQSIIETPVPIRVSTAGLPGAEFVEVDALAGFVGIEFLQVRSDGGPMVLCIDAGPAELTSGAMTLPTGFVGGETMTVAIDGGTPVVVTFQAGDQSLAQVVARINAAFALAGLPTPRCVAVGTTQIKLLGIRCGIDPAAPANASVVVSATPAAIPFPTTSAYATGAHIPIQGLFVAEFPPYPNAPKRVEVSGQGTLSILAAGRTAS